MLSTELQKGRVTHWWRSTCAGGYKAWISSFVHQAVKTSKLLRLWRQLKTSVHPHLTKCLLGYLWTFERDVLPNPSPCHWLHHPLELQPVTARISSHACSGCRRGWVVPCTTNTNVHWKLFPYRGHSCLTTHKPKTRSVFWFVGGFFSEKNPRYY